MGKFNVYKFLLEFSNDVEQEDEVNNSPQDQTMANQMPQMDQANQNQPPEMAPNQMTSGDGGAFRQIIGSTISNMEWKASGGDWSLTITMANSNIPLVISQRGGGAITASGPVPQDSRGKQVVMLSQGG